MAYPVRRRVGRNAAPAASTDDVRADETNHTKGSSMMSNVRVEDVQSIRSIAIGKWEVRVRLPAMKRAKRIMVVEGGPWGFVGRYETSRECHFGDGDTVEDAACAAYDEMIRWRVMK